MGTNYYGVRKPTAQHLNTIAKEVLNGNLGVVKVMLESFETIHIGKSSAGWKFLFDHNNQEWSNIEEYKSFIKEHEISSEYGNPISFEEFWNMVDSKQILRLASDFEIDNYCFSRTNNFC